MAVKRKPEGDSTFSAVQKKLLGEEVQKLRERRIQTGPDIARVLEVSPATYSRSERGQGTFAIRDLRRILEYLDSIEPIPQEKTEELIALQRLANQRGRYGKYFSYVPPAMKRYAELEWGASCITELADNHICGLFQSEAYVTALTQAGPEPEISQRYLKFRLARQEVVTRPGGAPQVVVFQHESALRILVGGREVMRQQLAYLLEMVKLPNVTFRIIPFGAGFPSPHLGMLDFDSGAAPVLVSGSFGTVNPIDNYTQANLARHYFTLAGRNAAPAEDSSAIITNIIETI